MDLTIIMDSFENTEAKRLANNLANQNEVVRLKYLFQRVYDERKLLFKDMYAVLSKAALTDIRYKANVILIGAALSPEVQKLIQTVLSEKTVKETVYDTSPEPRFKTAYDAILVSVGDYLTIPEVDIISQTDKEKTIQIEQKILETNDAMRDLIGKFTLLKNKIDLSLIPDADKSIINEIQRQMDAGYQEKA